MAKIKFYDVKGKKPVMIDSSKTKTITKKHKKGTTTMLTAIAPGGNRVYKIIGMKRK